MDKEPPSPDDSPEIIDLQRLSFADLKRIHLEAAQLAATTFHQTPDGFENAKGDAILIGKTGSGVFKITALSRGLTDVHRFMCTPQLSASTVLVTGSSNKEEMMQALRKMLTELGNRIIE